MRPAGKPPEETGAAAGPTETPEPLSPAVSAALEEGGGTLAERLERIASRTPSPGRHTPLGEVGAGSMGRVLRVWDEVLQRELAMKVIELAPALPGEVGAHDRRLSRFVEEARITGQLDHPGIVPVHEIGVEAGRAYFTMPLVRGLTLSRVTELARQGAEGWSLHRVLDVLHLVCRTVAFAHARGVVHRDLKPDNVMVGPYGEVYVVDWGLALIVGRAEQGAVVGTPAYMAPEQASGDPEDVGPLSDVYSLGAILYEILAGSVPHQASLDERGRLDEVLSTPPRPLAEVAADVPPELAAICEHAMAARPEERYPSASELADDLRAWLEGRIVDAYGGSAWTRVRKWRARNRGLARSLQALAVLLVASAVTIVALQQSRLRTVAAKTREAERSGYVASMSAAELALRALEVEVAERRLESAPEPLRGWEWEHLALRADASTATLRGHSEAVRSVAAAPLGELLATGSDDGTIRVWDARTGASRSTLRGHTGWVTALAFHPEGRLLASASPDGTVRLWDAREGEAVRVLLDGGADVHALAFSPDGTALAVGDQGGSIRLCSLADGSPRARLGTTGPPVKSLAFHPGEQRLAAGDATGFVRLWDLSEGSLVQQAFVGDRTVEAVAFDPWGRRLAAAVDKRGVLLDPTNLAIVAELVGHARTVRDVAFDVDGSRVVTASIDRTLRVWDAATGEPLEALLGHENEVSAIAFLPDGRLVSGGEDGTARLWRPGGGATVVLSGHEGWVTSLAFDSTGERLVSGGRDATLRIWNPRTGAALETVVAPGGVDCVAWGERERIAFGSGDRAVRIGAPVPGSPWRVLATRGRAPEAVITHAATDALLARDASGVSAWDVGTGELRLTVDLEVDLYAIFAVHPDGGSFALADEEGVIQRRDARDGRLLGSFEVPDDHASALAFSPDGSLLAAGTRRARILAWDLESGELVHTLTGHQGPVTDLAFHPSGSRLASGSLDDTVRIWNLDTSEALLTLRGHTAAITAVCFDPRGTQLASASMDGTIRLWRTRAALSDG